MRNSHSVHRFHFATIVHIVERSNRIGNARRSAAEVAPRGGREREGSAVKPDIRRLTPALSCASAALPLATTLNAPDVARAGCRSAAAHRGSHRHGPPPRGKQSARPGRHHERHRRGAGECIHPARRGAALRRAQPADFARRPFGNSVPGYTVRGQRQLEALATQDPSVVVYLADVPMMRPHGTNGSFYDLFRECRY